ncbi:MAG: class I tRNA ligase family protein [Coriobacteriales bacterium]|jgi:methionyl-tRNA synthetase|nr:class I tRNA ligase family protein [Coriobacteriales bacterium]
MPYGNKGLHFGHIGGVFVPADVFARFLRDRIGAENVLFVCGTDCYGSPIDEGYRRLVAEGAFKGTVEEFVRHNHDAQSRTLKSYCISLDIYEGSGLGSSKPVHAEVSADIIRDLHRAEYLHKLTTAQFYDERAQTFLNGRQVVGRCPVPGCKSEKAYADECDLGHQYLPLDLVAPRSTVTGETPVMRDVSNWYFDLPAFSKVISAHNKRLSAEGTTRPVVTNTVEEFLAPPSIYVKNEHFEAYEALCADGKLPPHEYSRAEKGKASFELVFDGLEAREEARGVLEGAGMRLRTGKTLVPFRITGNITWGVPAPTLEDAVGDASARTVWCWPESLWAPVSFTRTRLESGIADVETLNPERPVAAEEQDWRDYWCDPSAAVYQFIGQDNIYFYGVAQTALWEALRTVARPSEALQLTKLVANYHLLFLDKKASSSSAVRPPTADELLEHYTAEQLRAHFLALGLGQRPVSFQPKPLNPAADPKAGDPVLKEGSLLTNVLNRLARSCFYAAARDLDGHMPLTVPDEAVETDVRETLLAYERHMHAQEFHAVMHLADGFIRRANKYWTEGSRLIAEDPTACRSVLGNAFYLLRAACLVMHPVAPEGTRMVFEYLELPVTEQEFFSWDHAFARLERFVGDAARTKGAHPVRDLPPRTDFFCRHQSQLD